MNVCICLIYFMYRCKLLRHNFAQQASYRGAVWQRFNVACTHCRLCTMCRHYAATYVSIYKGSSRATALRSPRCHVSFEPTTSSRFICEIFTLASTVITILWKRMLIDNNNKKNLLKRSKFAFNIYLW